MSLALSLVLGTAVGLARSFVPRGAAWPFAAYTEFFRNIPPIVQFFFWYFAAALDVFPAAVISLSVFTSAYIAEIVRSGIRAIPRTQVEAARASGEPDTVFTSFMLSPETRPTRINVAATTAACRIIAFPPRQTRNLVP